MDLPNLPLSLAAAAAVSAAAWRLRALNRAGAAAAVAVGTIVLAWGGLAWALTLIAFFVASSALSAFRWPTKERRLGEGLPDRRGRNARQVLANGGFAAVAALGHGWAPGALWPPVFFGSLAAAAADTWATELGVLASRLPRSIRTWRPVPPGTSGGVTCLGTGAAIAGAAFVAAVAYALGEAGPGAALVVWTAGAGGALVDSVLGATAQARFQCVACGAAVESRVHPACGAPTTHAWGVRFIDNDVVNLLGCGVGAGVALALW